MPGERTYPAGLTEERSPIHEAKALPKCLPPPHYGTGRPSLTPRTSPPEPHRPNLTARTSPPIPPHASTLPQPCLNLASTQTLRYSENRGTSCGYGEDGHTDTSLQAGLHTL